MTDTVALYREPAELLGRELDYLKKRLLKERAEANRFRDMRTDQRDDELEILVERAESDAGMTASLIRDYRAAVKAVEKLS